MKILFLTDNFPPEVNPPATRTMKNIKEWVKKDDIHITVITCFPNYPKGKVYSGYKNKFYTDIDPQLMTFTLHKVMTTTALRKAAIKIFRNFKDSSITDKEIFCKLLDFTSISNEKLLIK